MKSKMYSTVLACLSSGLIASAAFAQNDPATQQGGKSTQPGAPTGKEMGHAMMHGYPVPASKLMGAQIKSATGETLGTLTDFILAPQSGRIEFGVLSLTGPTGTTPTGAGEKLTPIPWPLLTFNPPPAGGGQQYTFTANVDQNKLNSAPSFDRNNWPDLSQPEWHQKIFSYYGISPREGGTGGTGGTGTGGSGTDKGAGTGGMQPKSDTH